MSSIYSKNGVLSGHIEHYCLICAVLFTNEEDALEHIVDKQHKDKLKACGYYEKYKEDFIRKAQGVYFCEPCSLTFPTATKVELHIDEQSHIIEKTKINPWLKRVGNNIIAFNQFIITDDSWNSCVEDTCALCNAEFDDSASHKVIRSHILNLIKSEVIFDNVNKTVYRTIDARSKQCLTCNMIIENDPTSHFETVEHKEAYQLYDNSIQTNEEKNTRQGSKTANTKATPNVKEDKKVDNDNVNGDNNKETDINASRNVTTDKNDVTKHVKTEAKKEATKPVDKEKVKRKPLQTGKKENAEELDKIYCKNLDAKNYIIADDKEKWCILCEWLLVDSPEEHIRGKHHQNILKAHKERLAEKNNDVSSKDEKSILYESVDKYQNSNVNIDLINETAFCKKCSKNIDFNTSAIDKHIEEHKKTTSKKSPETLCSGIKSNGTDRTTLFTKPVLLGKDKRARKTVSVGDYAKKHGLTHNRADSSYYCHPCSRRLPSVLDDLQKHIASRIHTENTQESLKAPSPKKVKEPLSEFIKSFEFAHTNNNELIIIFNDKYWINVYAFLLIAKNKHETIFCHGCHIDLTQKNVVEHIAMNDNHRGLVEKCLIISSLENEFIREITLDVYHCGYCSITVNDWDEVLDHITMTEHIEKKSNAEQCLRDHELNPYRRANWTEMDDLIKQFVLFHGI